VTVSMSQTHKKTWVREETVWRKSPDLRKGEERMEARRGIRKTDRRAGHASWWRLPTRINRGHSHCERGNLDRGGLSRKSKETKRGTHLKSPGKRGQEKQNREKRGHQKGFAKKKKKKQGGDVFTSFEKARGQGRSFLKSFRSCNEIGA